MQIKPGRYLRKWPYLVYFLSIHLGQLDPLHFEVSGPRPQTQHSNEPKAFVSRPKAKIKAGEVAVVRKAVLAVAVGMCSAPMLVNRCGYHTCEKAKIRR